MFPVAGPLASGWKKEPTHCTPVTVALVDRGEVVIGGGEVAETAGGGVVLRRNRRCEIGGLGEDDDICLSWEGETKTECRKRSKG